MKSYSNHLRLAAISAVHAAVLTVLTFLWMNVSWEYGDEILVARVNEVLKELVFQQKDAITERLQSDLLLVNTSYDKMLIPFEDAYASGTRAVTDRKKLAEFLHLLEEKPPKLIVIDLLFDYPSPFDSMLAAQVKRLPRVVLATRFEENAQTVKPFPSASYGLAYYSTFSGTFLKYPIAQTDSVKFLPARMWELLHQKNITKTAGFARNESTWWFNAPIIDISFRRNQILNNELLMWNLGDVFNYPDAFPAEKVATMVDNKIVIVGDFFEYDEHQTLLGQEPGPLLLANAYLTLARDIARIRIRDFMLVFLLYFSTTLYIVRLKRLQYRMGNWQLFKWKIGKFIVKYLTYLLVFSLCTVLLYFYTGKHFQLLLFALYFNVIDFLASKYEPQVARWLNVRPEKGDNEGQLTVTDSTQPDSQTPPKTTSSPPPPSPS